MTTKISCMFMAPDGSPMANASVEVRLSESAYNNSQEGIVVPRLITLSTDENGQVTLLLWPSAEKYSILVEDPLSDALAYYEFYVPESTEVLRLQDLSSISV